MSHVTRSAPKLQRNVIWKPCMELKIIRKQPRSLKKQEYHAGSHGTDGPTYLQGFTSYQTSMVMLNSIAILMSKESILSATVKKAVLHGFVFARTEERG